MRLQWSSPDLYWHNQAISQAMGLPQLQDAETTLPFVKTPDPLPCTAKLRPKVLRHESQSTHKLAPRIVLVKDAASKMYACMSTGSAGATQLLLGERFTQA